MVPMDASRIGSVRLPVTELRGKGVARNASKSSDQKLGVALQCVRCHCVVGQRQFQRRESIFVYNLIYKSTGVLR